jgi:RND family efflux transporter MFP subunit
MKGLITVHVSSSLSWRLALCLIVTLLLAAPYTGCGSDGDSASNGDSTATAAGEKNDSSGAEESDSKKRKERVTSVNCARVERNDLVVPIIAEGTIRARHAAEIRTELEGRLDRILVDEGQSVRKGQLLAKIDAREYQVGAEEARAQYLEALSRLAVEEDSLEVLELSSRLKEKLAEIEKLERSGTITREERLAREIVLDVEALKEGYYRVDIIASRSGVAAARSNLERARLNLEHTQIRAPFAGVVSRLTLSIGELVSKGQTFCSLVDNIDIEADVGVLEADMAHLAVGSPALLVVPSLSDTIAVTVDVISPHFDRETRTCQVLMRFTEKNGRVRPGMFVRAIIAGQSFPDRLLVPSEAILTRDSRPLLFKVHEDRTQWLYLTLGERNDQVVEVVNVLQGGTLSPGDLVVVSDHLTLSHDAKVKVKEVLTANDPWRSHHEDS